MEWNISVFIWSSFGSAASRGKDAISSQCLLDFFYLFSHEEMYSLFTSKQVNVHCCLLFVVKQNELLRVAVVRGQRPDLTLINGAPDSYLMNLAVDWIERCWHQNPDSRPAFTGILHELLASH